MLTRRRERQRIRAVSSSVCVRAILLLNDNRRLCSYFLLILHLLLGLPYCTVSQVLVIKLVWHFSAELVCGHRVSSQWGVGLPHVQVQCCFTCTKTIRTVRDREPRTATSTFTQLLSSEATCYVLPTDQGDILDYVNSPSTHFRQIKLPRFLSGRTIIDDYVTHQSLTSGESNLLDFSVSVRLWIISSHIDFRRIKPVRSLANYRLRHAPRNDRKSE